MRWIWIVATLFVGCSGGAQVQSRKLDDGSLSFTCELPMEDCVRVAAERCRYQRFRILEGTSETRVRDVPPMEQSYHTSRLVIACTQDGDNPLISLTAPTPSAKPAPDAPQTHGPACTIGETRTCVGPGACNGGQACLPDRSGFGPCDCGPAPAAAAADSAASSAPAPSTPPAAPQ
jgi:hypothetical protein